MNYFTISEFGKLRNVNINSLRYYEKIGILKPDHVDAKTGYRYYTPDQLPILDVILLCLDFGMPLKELKSYISDDNFINNSRLFEIGEEIARERLHRAVTELNKIEYTRRYIESNRRYNETEGEYCREIPERTIVAMEYDGDLTDIRKIEMTSAGLYSYALEKKLSPVFPAGLIVRKEQDNIKLNVFLEIMDKNTEDPYAITMPAGKFRCQRIEMTPEMDLPGTIEKVYGAYQLVIVANILLDKYQIGTKKSELQMLDP